jgi:hypothetical protein
MSPGEVENWVFGDLMSHLLQAGGFIFFCVAAVSLAAAFYGVAGALNRKWQLGTAWIGVPVHELAHAVTCLFFGMKVREIKFFQPDPQSGQLGYVNFVYAPGLIQHRVGLFFVGIAPFLAGAAAVYFLLDFAGVDQFDAFVSAEDAGANPVAYLVEAGRWAALVFGSAFQSWLHFLVIFVAGAIALHAAPSWADVRIAGKGVLFAWLFVALVLLGVAFLVSSFEAELGFLASVMNVGFVAFSQLAVLMVAFALLGLVVFLPVRAVSMGFRPV